MLSVLRYLASVYRKRPSEEDLHLGEDIMLMPIVQLPPNSEEELQSAVCSERPLTGTPTPRMERETPARYFSTEDDEEPRGRSRWRKGEEPTSQSSDSTSSATDTVPPFRTPRDASPYPHPQLPPASEMEPFPEFVDTWTDWDEGDYDGGAQDAYMQHCLVHCNHIICWEMVERTKDAEGRDWSCRGCNTLTSPITVPVDMGRIANMTRRDVENARLSYEQLNGEATITVDLQSAVAIVKKLKTLDVLNVEAVSDANTLKRKLLAYFKTSLKLCAAQTRRMTVQELEKEMKDCMRLEVLWWCLPSTHRSGGWMYDELAKLNRGELREEVKVLMERVEVVVQEVVVVLVWWDNELLR